MSSNARTGKEAHTALSWRASLASGIYHTGLLNFLQWLARTRELRTAGGRLPWPRAADPRFAILCYHRVGVEGVPLYSRLEPSVFEAQMRHLRQNYRVLSLTDLLSELERPSSSVPAVAVTFDDGYRDVFEYAFPTLRKYEIPATIFVVAEAIETGLAPWYDRIFLALAISPGPSLTIELDAPTTFSLHSFASRIAATNCIVHWLREQTDDLRRDFCADLNRRIPVPEDQLRGRMLTWEQLRIMRRYRMTCGSHTITHPVLSRVDRQSLFRELRVSRLILEQQLGPPVTDFAFPFGKATDCNGVTSGDLFSCGYRSAVTTIPGTNRPGTDRFALHRVSIGELNQLPLFAYQLNSLFLRGEDPPTVIPSMETSQIAAVSAVASREDR